MTGYDLKTRCFDDGAGHLWTADQAQVYRTLDRLSREGRVRSRLVPQRGKPDRKVFSITHKGRRALETWLRDPEDPSPVRDPFLLHILLSSDLPDGEIIAQLERARGQYQQRLDDLRGRARTEVDAWERATRRSRDAELRRMTIAASVAAARTSIDWIDDSIERVSKGLPAPPSDAARGTDGGIG